MQRMERGWRATICESSVKSPRRAASSSITFSCVRRTWATRLRGNGLRSLEQTADVKGVSPHAGRIGCDSKIGIVGLEVRDFGVCAPAGIGGASVAQVVVGKAELPARQIELAGEFVRQRFVIEVAVLLR